MKSLGVRLDTFKIVPEEIIIQCASHFKEDEENNFRTFLDTGEQFKMAGLTPVYICDNKMKEFIVTSKEKLQGSYH